MRLYIAEKPSLARAIAAALSGPQQKGPGWIRCGTGAEAATVSWCIGHLLEPAEPGHYNPAWKSWRLEDLPLFPEHWQLTPKESVRQQLAVLESLIRKADIIIHAGDPDREGQLLVDEVLNHVGIHCPVQRVLIRDLTPAAVARALREPRDNREFLRLSRSALARQQADWLYGINLTRFYTLSYQRQGQQGVYSVGRVQTPVLGLVVRRDRTIEHFTPSPYYRIEASFRVPGSDTPPFTARWLPDDAFQDYLDEDRRLLDKSVAERIAAEVRERPGMVIEARFRDRPEAPPLPLSLSALQIEAARIYQMDARSVLDTAQSLYEQHQLITYPRSDCRYLPEEHFRQRQQVLHAIAQVAPDLADHCRSADSGRRTEAWNDKQVDAHHAIIPTTRTRPKGRLSEAEARIYGLVCRYYLMQFAGDAIHREGRLTVQVDRHRFRATESSLADPGWKSLAVRRREEDDPAQEKKPPLPRLRQRDSVYCAQAQANERMTRPPQHFTDATLLSAMTNIARFVSDPELRRTLRETDGLGTEATRASIIETLFRRDYLFREGRFIRATDKGRMLIEALPESVSTPDRTAIWEASLEAIRRGEAEAEAFLTRLQDEIRALLDIPETEPPEQNDSHDRIHCPKCRAPMVEREGRFGRFRACSRYPRCTGTRPLEETRPQDGTSQKPVPCPHCFSPLVRRKGKKGWFWGCSNFPACRHTVNDIDGMPDVRLRKTT